MRAHPIRQLMIPIQLMMTTITIQKLWIECRFLMGEIISKVAFILFFPEFMQHDAPTFIRKIVLGGWLRWIEVRIGSKPLVS